MKERPILMRGEMVRATLNGLKTQTRRIVIPRSKPSIKPLEMEPWYSNDEQLFHYDKQFELIDGRVYCRKNGLPVWIGKHPSYTTGEKFFTCPYGGVGDRLWVRETWRVGAWNEDQSICVDYRADADSSSWLTVPDNEEFDRLWIQSTEDAIKAGLCPDEGNEYHWKKGEAPTRWRPSIHMPRWAARLILEIADVRCERLQDISEEDALAEGVRRDTHPGFEDTIIYQNYSREDWNVPCHTAVDSFRTLWESINSKRGHSWNANPWVWVVEFGRIEKQSGRVG